MPFGIGAQDFFPLRSARRTFGRSRTRSSDRTRYRRIGSADRRRHHRNVFFRIRLRKPRRKRGLCAPPLAIHASYGGLVRFRKSLRRRRPFPYQRSISRALSLFARSCVQTMHEAKKEKHHGFVRFQLPSCIVDCRQRARSSPPRCRNCGHFARKQPGSGCVLANR